VAFPFLFNPNSKDHVGDSSLESRLYRAVTGVDLSETESYETGDMLNTLERAIQVREGRTRDDDVLHEICYTTEDAGERRYDRQDLEKAKDAYYELVGWDRQGIPKADRLKALKIADVADGLKDQTRKV
jgi:aldehyde:ferredoxin oxidoreductase